MCHAICSRACISTEAQKIYRIVLVDIVRNFEECAQLDGTITCAILCLRFSLTNMSLWACTLLSPVSLGWRCSVGCTTARSSSLCSRAREPQVQVRGGYPSRCRVGGPTWPSASSATLSPTVFLLSFKKKENRDKCRWFSVATVIGSSAGFVQWRFTCGVTCGCVSLRQWLYFVLIF